MTVDDQVPNRILRLVETPPRYPPFLGGVENVAQAICTRLVAQGDEVLVICADDPRGSPEIGDGVAVRRLPWHFKIANTNITLGLPCALAKTEWDVVSTHLPTPWSADWSIVVARLLGRASVLNFYNSIVGTGWTAFVARIYRATLLRLLLRLADRTIVVSDYWRDVVIATDFSVRHRLCVIPTGVDLDHFSVGTGGNGNQLLFVGILDQFHRYKGLDDLLSALGLVDRPFHLTVVGDGALRAEYERVASNLGIADKISFLGHVDSESLLAAYQSADIYVLPSKVAGQEGGFTLTALEAMATGRAVVLADGVGQLAREVESVGAGIRVPAGDPRALAAALDRLLGDSEEIRRLGRAAREYVERHHSWDEIAMARREVYLEAVRAASNRQRGRAGARRGPPTEQT